MYIIEWLDNRGIKVNNKELIKQAFMHTSYANEHRKNHDNERLEFMGDAVLELWCSEKLFKREPILKEGQMTTLRAQLVCEKALSMYAKELKLNEFLLLGMGEEKSGGRNRDSIVSDMFEAFLGALYLDQCYCHAYIILIQVNYRSIIRLSFRNMFKVILERMLIMNLLVIADLLIILYLLCR